MDDSQENAQYDMIMGQYLLSELRLDLCFSDYNIRVNIDVYKVCTVSMRDTKTNYVGDPSNLRNGAIFRDE